MLDRTPAATFPLLPTHDLLRKLAILSLSAILAGCAQLSAAPSPRYDGIYDLSSTAATGLAQYCASDDLRVAIRDGQLDFTVHSPNEWHGFVDQNGYFHGQSAYGARVFKLLDGVTVPGIVGHDDQRCQYDYRFTPIRNGVEPHSSVQQRP
jgi:hypothetical protein